MRQLKLIDFLKLLESDISPLVYDPAFEEYSVVKTSFEVIIHFGEYQIVKCNIDNPILVPWYDEIVKSICPVDDHCMDIWISSSGVRNLYTEYFKEVEPYESNNKSDISNS